VIGPIQVGVSRLVFDFPAPNFEKIPKESLLGVTVLLLEAAYKSSRFTTIGYYVVNELIGSYLRAADIATATNTASPIISSSDSKPSAAGRIHPQRRDTEQQTIEDAVLLESITPDKIVRRIEVDSARVTQFPIFWDSSETDIFANRATDQANSLSTTSTEALKNKMNDLSISEKQSATGIGSDGDTAGENDSEEDSDWDPEDFEERYVCSSLDYFSPSFDY